MTALLSAALFWGGCAFWLSAFGLTLWVVANEWSVRRRNNQAAAAGNRWKAGRLAARGEVRPIPKSEQTLIVEGFDGADGKWVRP